MNPKTLVPTVLSSRVDRGGQSVNIMHMRAWLLSNDNINHKHQQLQVLLAKGELYRVAQRCPCSLLGIVGSFFKVHQDLFRDFF